MGDAFAWVGRLAEWLASFIPRLVIIPAYQGGIKFVRGSKIVPLKPGLHVYWPLVTLLETFPTARQADELRGQTIVTTDDKTILVGGLIVYEVVDLESLLGKTFKGEQAVRDMAISAIHDTICQMSWKEVKAEQRSGKLDTKLRNEAKRTLDSYGVRIIKLVLTDLAPCRVYKLVNTNARGEE